MTYLFKKHSCTVGEYSKEQHPSWFPHLWEQPEISSSIDFPPIWPAPGISPGLSKYPAGQPTINEWIGVINFQSLLAFIVG